MKKLALMIFAAATVFAAAAAGSASAQVYYSGPGFGVQVAPRYEEQRHYRRQHNSRAYHNRQYRRAGRCPPHYTVQDGVCKPYRGY